EVALRAARAGADVTGVDISKALLDRARTSADRARLPVRLELGDAQALPYADESFDVVASCFGAIFAPDHDAVAAELARVCRRGGRLGLTTWRPKPDIERIYERFQDRSPASNAEAWGDPARIRELLGASFELAIEERLWRLEGGSAEEVYEFMASSAPPMKAFLETLDRDRRSEFREALLEHWNQFRDGDGVSEPRPYLLVLGRRT
ncbi:MAG: class I SAM-dependent methyltransferase, partial [Actinomycetota bacterium]|nr:class I SAM-dependent methyltransferase [Actinomycetota bacterium]